MDDPLLIKCWTANWEVILRFFVIFYTDKEEFTCIRKIDENVSNTRKMIQMSAPSCKMIRDVNRKPKSGFENRI